MGAEWVLDWETARGAGILRDLYIVTVNLEFRLLDMEQSGRGMKFEYQLVADTDAKVARLQQTSGAVGGDC
jgi:hypothetical protein